MGANLRWDLATIEMATARAGACVSLVFGDVGRQLGEFGNLMPGRLGVTGPGFRGQGSLAVGADHRHVRHDLVDPLGREAMAMVYRMPRLSAWLTSGRCLDDRFGSPRWIDEGGEEEFDELRFSWERAVRGFRLVNRQSAYGLCPIARELRSKQLEVCRTQDKRPQGSREAPSYITRIRR